MVWCVLSQRYKRAPALPPSGKYRPAGKVSTCNTSPPHSPSSTNQTVKVWQQCVTNDADVASVLLYTGCGQNHKGHKHAHNTCTQTTSSINQPHHYRKHDSWESVPRGVTTLS